MFAVVRVESGILEGVTLFEDREEALRFGRDQWAGAELGPNAEGEDIDPEWGGVARGYVMHWFDDDDDVWVTEPEAKEDDRELCPFCRNGAIEGERYQRLVNELGRHTIEGALENVAFEEEEGRAWDDPPLCPAFAETPTPCPLTEQECQERHRHTLEHRDLDEHDQAKDKGDGGLGSGAWMREEGE